MHNLYHFGTLYIEGLKYIIKITALTVLQFISIRKN